MGDNDEGVLPVVRKEHIDAGETHCAQPQVEDDLVNPTTELGDENEVPLECRF